MLPRKFAVDGKNKDGKDFKIRTNEKKYQPSTSGNFFIKPSKNNKKLGATSSRGNSNLLDFNQQKEYVKKEKKQADTLEDNAEPKTGSKPFNKKAWRLKRYSNKHKLQEWKDVRKNNMLRRYNRTLGKNKSSSFDYEEDANLIDQEENPTDGQAPNDGDLSEPNRVIPQNKRFNKSHQEDQEVQDRKAELLKRKQEKEEAIKEYKRKKIEKFKKLSRKTKKGQPVMKDRIEVLLEEIQNSIKN